MDYTDSALTQNNLLVLLFRLAHRQQENFTTEAFVHVLRFLMSEEWPTAAELLNWLTNSNFFSSDASGASLSIRTQACTEENGIPDVRIEDRDLDVIIEVKLDGSLTYEQAKAYADELTRRARPRCALVALTGAVPTAVLPEPTFVRTWGELGLTLVRLTDKSQSEVVPHVVRQFVGLLNRLSLMPLKVRSPLSAELKAHREWANAKRDAPALTRNRVKSIVRLTEMEHTEQLANLLLQMRQVVADSPCVVSHALDSAPFMREAWIGYNINGMEYFFYVSLAQPERVILQRYGDGVDAASFDGSLGEIEPATSNEPPRWRCTLDLLDVDFFQKSAIEQVDILRDFFKRALTFGGRLRPTLGRQRMGVGDSGEEAPASSDAGAPQRLPAVVLCRPFPDGLREFVEAAPWTFAKTYAATWPHEYVVQTPENAEMIVALAKHIFEHGVEGRFYSQIRKYHHEGGKVYWSMDSAPESTTLINRCDEKATYEARLAAGTLPK